MIDFFDFLNDLYCEHSEIQSLDEIKPILSGVLN